MRWALLILFLLSPFLAAQDEVAGDKPEEEVDASLTDNQKALVVSSVTDLKEAEDKLNEELGKINNRETRLNILMDNLKNQNEEISAKEASIRKILDQFQSGETTDTIPGVQVAHWESRNPIVAAKDFILLYQQEPSVAVALVKQMKKKKSARLIDEVSKLNTGKKIAAELHEAIGTGIIKKSDG